MSVVIKMGDESSLHMTEELRELLSDDNFSEEEEHDVNVIPEHSFEKKTNLVKSGPAKGKRMGREFSSNDHLDLLSRSLSASPR